MMTAIVWFLAGLHLLMWSVLIGNIFYLRFRAGDAAKSALELPRLSVIIPARNEEDNLSRLLPSLEMQTYPKFEVIVYDDASTDRTARVLSDYAERLEMHTLAGDGPPPGWVGKVNALYRGTRIARGDVFLFLDADVELTTDTALMSMVTSLLSNNRRSALTVLPHLTGGGGLLVSLIPHAFLTGLPWPLARFGRMRLLGALNGQAWMILAKDYHALEPHEHVKNEVLEDVEIGRYLIVNGITPVMIDATGLLTVRMYDDLREAWWGFRKNAYLLMGGSVVPFLAFLIIFAAANWLTIFFSPILFISSCSLKFVADRVARIPLGISLLAPISFLLATVLQIDSAVTHWRGAVEWKGRKVLS